MNPLTFFHTSIYGMRDLPKIVETCTLGENSDHIGSQPPKFKETPLAFCSYICEGYPRIYGDYAGIKFETDEPIIYACPSDSFELMRSGRYLPGHERFLFSSIEEMLKEYPTAPDFKNTFQAYFKKLDPVKMYPCLSKQNAILEFELDYCLSRDWTPGCNEVTFRKPLKIKNPKIFESGELKC